MLLALGLGADLFGSADFLGVTVAIGSFFTLLLLFPLDALLGLALGAGIGLCIAGRDDRSGRGAAQGDDRQGQ